MAKNHYSILLEQYKLNGKNYQDWVRNLKIILDSEERTYVLDSPYPLEVVGNDTPEDIAFKQKWANDDMQARCLMLASMIPELQRQHENYQYASQIYKHLEDLFQTPDRLTRYSVISGLRRRLFVVFQQCLDRVSTVSEPRRRLVVVFQPCIDRVSAESW